MPIEITNDEFDSYVEKAMDELPKDFKEFLQNEVELIVDDVPEDFLTAGMPSTKENEIRLGVYVGTSELHRDHYNALPSPHRIFLFRKNILRVCNNVEEAQQRIARTLQHELAHALGFSEQEIRDSLAL